MSVWYSAPMLDTLLSMDTGRGYLRETLSLIVKNGKITARELADMLKIEANTSGTRLLNLHKKRLVMRRDEMKDGARVWIYEKF